MKNISPFLLPYIERASLLLNFESSEFQYDQYLTQLIYKLNDLTNCSKIKGSSIDDLVRNSHDEIFDIAIKIRNHTLYFLSLTDSPKRIETCPALYGAVLKHFKNVDFFKQNFIQSLHSSNEPTWIWLVKRSNGAIFYLTSNDGNQPFGENIIPLMVCYVRCKNKYESTDSMINYLERFWSHIDWNFVEVNLKENDSLKVNSFLIQ